MYLKVTIWFSHSKMANQKQIGKDPKWDGWQYLTLESCSGMQLQSKLLSISTYWTGLPQQFYNFYYTARTYVYCMYSFSDTCQFAPFLITMFLLLLHSPFTSGIAQPIWWEDITGGGTDKNKEPGGSPATSTHSPTPPTQRRLAKSFSVAQSSVSKG